MNAVAPAEPRRPADWLWLAAGLAVSLAVLWFTVREPLVVAGFGGGVLALGGLAFVLLRRQPQAQEPELALPDWSVTVAAIEQPDTAVAITDRAGRLVCANPLFERWFGTLSSPPRLPADEASLERLAKAARSGWRDGQGRADLVEDAEGRRWRGEAVRAGRGEDFLVWRFTQLLASDPVAELVRHLDGKLGRALDRAGFAAAIVDPDGQIRTASAGLALRAVGDINAVLTGQGWEGVPEATRKQADTAWFRSVLQWDPEPVVRKVDQPLLIMHGALDKQVPVASAELLNGLAAKRGIARCGATSASRLSSGATARQPVTRCIVHGTSAPRRTHQGIRPKAYARRGRSRPA